MNVTKMPPVTISMVHITVLVFGVMLETVLIVKILMSALKTFMNVTRMLIAQISMVHIIVLVIPVTLEMV